MAISKVNTINRRFFIQSSALAGGGLMLGFNWLSGCKPESNPQELAEAGEWYELNGFLKIGDNGQVTLMAPNPEGGQNVKTSMPMIVADELDIPWDKVIVEQAPLNTEMYSRQFIGGSQAIRQGWQTLRTAGATARYMLCAAAAGAWEVPADEISTEAGILYHKGSGRSAHYGEMASAAAGVPIPGEVALKDPKDFTIIGTSQKNVDGRKIVTGKPLFGIDVQRNGMLIAMVVHPPAFGMQLRDFDDSAVRAMPGIRDVFRIKNMEDDYERQYFDTCSFHDILVVVGESTWQVMNAKKALTAEWEPMPDTTFIQDRFGTRRNLVYPSGLESNEAQLRQMDEKQRKAGTVLRKDGNPGRFFNEASTVVERTYTAPFLAHNCMEPMNFFADVKEGKAELMGPLQKPEYTEKTVAARLGIPLEEIEVKMTRLGGGYGRRSYAHWMVEAAIISQKMRAPVKLVYSREDDMTSGIYRPMYQATYRAALDKDGNLTALHVRAGGIPESPLYPNRFPAGAVDHYLAEEWSIDSNVTVGSFRAPRSNFIAGAEQAFLDEVAEAAGKDPIQFRLDLLEKAGKSPVGTENDYDVSRYSAVLKLLREQLTKDNVDSSQLGIAAYFCHNTYVAQAMEISMVDGKPKVGKVYCAVDCGRVINPDAAVNMAEGAVVDGIGTALYGALTLKDGKPLQTNFDSYRMIRHSEAPREIKVEFVDNGQDPTGMGEPAYPPVMGALANALYRATGNRYYRQPYFGDRKLTG